MPPPRRRSRARLAAALGALVAAAGGAGLYQQARSEPPLGGPIIIGSAGTGDSTLRDGWEWVVEEWDEDDREWELVEVLDPRGD